MARQYCVSVSIMNWVRSSPLDACGPSAESREVMNMRILRMWFFLMLGCLLPAGNALADMQDAILQGFKRGIEQGMEDARRQKAANEEEARRQARVEEARREAEREREAEEKAIEDAKVKAAAERATAERFRRNKREALADFRGLSEAEKGLESGASDRSGKAKGPAHQTAGSKAVANSANAEARLALVKVSALKDEKQRDWCIKHMPKQPSRPEGVSDDKWKTLQSDFSDEKRIWETNCSPRE